MPAAPRVPKQILCGPNVIELQWSTIFPILAETKRFAFLYRSKSPYDLTQLSSELSPVSEVVAHLVGNEHTVDDDVEFGVVSQKLFNFRVINRVLKEKSGFC